MKIFWFSMVLGLSVVLFGATALAADKSGKDQVKRMQQLLRKAEQDASRLTGEKEAAEGQLKVTQDKLDATQRKAESLGAKASALMKELESVKSEKEVLSVKLADTGKLLADTTVKLKETEADSRRLEMVSASQKETIAVCEGNNAKLYQYGTEVLSQYRHKGCTAALLQAEPVTGLKRVEIENLMEDYRDKFDQQKLSSPKEAATGSHGGS